MNFTTHISASNADILEDLDEVQGPPLSAPPPAGEPEEQPDKPQDESKPDPTS